MPTAIGTISPAFFWPSGLPAPRLRLISSGFSVWPRVAAAVSANYPGIPITPSMSAGATDGVFFRGAGIPTYGVGEAFMREEDEFSHGLNERNPTASFYNGLNHWRTLVTTLAARR